MVFLCMKHVCVSIISFKENSRNMCRVWRLRLQCARHAFAGLQLLGHGHGACSVPSAGTTGDASKCTFLGVLQQKSFLILYPLFPYKHRFKVSKPMFTSLVDDQYGTGSDDSKMGITNMRSPQIYRNILMHALMEKRTKIPATSHGSNVRNTLLNDFCHGLRNPNQFIDQSTRYWHDPCLDWNCTYKAKQTTFGLSLQSDFFSNRSKEDLEQLLLIPRRFLGTSRNKAAKNFWIMCKKCWLYVLVYAHDCILVVKIMTSQMPCFARR